jgi:hypothetical protein
MSHADAEMLNATINHWAWWICLWLAIGALNGVSR